MICVATRGEACRSLCIHIPKKSDNQKSRNKNGKEKLKNKETGTRSARIEKQAVCPYHY